MSDRGALPGDGQLERTLVMVSALAVWAIGMIAGTWWIDDDLPRGFMALFGMVVWTLHISSGMVRFNAIARCYVAAFVPPLIIATAAFGYGFMR